MPTINDKVPNKLSNHMPKIKILSVGINKYLSDRIRNLGKCVQDVELMQAFLRDNLHIPDTHFKLLTNEEATRQNIIHAFRTHFKDLSAGDIAVFHYSGHGSREGPIQAFVDAKIDSAGSKTEVLVCHDSSVNNVYNIADKELRWLIHELQYTGEGGKTDVKFVAMLDCCHSGSMFRNHDTYVARRLHPGQKKARSLTTLLEGQYASMTSLHLPEVNYISLSACSPRESAIEDSDGGVFTNALLSVLRRSYEAGRMLNYMELFSSVREITKVNAYNHQTPYFEYTGNVNPYSNFLSSTASERIGFPVLTIHGQEGRISLGAIHGVNPSSLKEMKIPIYEDLADKPIGTAELKQVELEYTKVENIKLNNPEYQNKDIRQLEKQYLAGIKGIPLPIRLESSSNAEHLRSEVLNALSLPKYAGKFFIDEFASYILTVEATQLVIYREVNNKRELIHGVKSVSETAITYILWQLLQITHWEQINSVTNSKNSLIDTNELDFSFTYTDYNNYKNTLTVGPEITDGGTMQAVVEYNQNKKGIPYELSVNNRSSDHVYFYLVHLYRKFKVKQKFENFAHAVAPQSSITLYNSVLKQIGLGLSDDATEGIDIFLLIASLEELNLPYLFEQQGFQGAYGRIINSPDEWKEKYDRMTKEDMSLGGHNKINWAVKRLEVKLIKK